MSFLPKPSTNYALNRRVRHAFSAVMVLKVIAIMVTCTIHPDRSAALLPVAIIDLLIAVYNLYDFHRAR